MTLNDTPPPLNRVPQELIGDVLDFLDHASLCACEQVCSRFRKLISERDLWRWQFKRQVQTHHWALPNFEVTKDGWKDLYRNFFLELQVRPSLWRNGWSANFVWRWLELSAVTDEQPKISPTFLLGKVNNTPIEWQIVLERADDGVESWIGVSLQQCTPIHVRFYFSLSLLDDQGDSICVVIEQAHENYHSEDPIDQLYGSYVDMESLDPILDGRQDIRIGLDLTVFPDSVDGLGDVYEFISRKDELHDPLRRSVVAMLSSFLMKYAEDPRKAKAYAQRFQGGPYPLVDLLESQDTSIGTRIDAAAALTNIFDTTEIVVPESLVARIVTQACKMLYTMTVKAKTRDQESLNQSDLNDLELVDQALLAEDETEDETRFVLGGCVGAILGVLYNLPIANQFRKLLSSGPRLFESIFEVLDDPEVANAHFSGAHILVQLLYYGEVPAQYLPDLRKHIRQYLDRCAAMESISREDVGIFLFLRDVVDFFIPLLRSKELECVEFGAWCVDLYFYKQRVEP